MVYVSSSTVEAIGYSPETMELHVTFLGGGQYVYSNVPQSVYDAFMNAGSKGTFLNEQIKNVYPYTKL
jgi:hypothetical protein